ncbi:hypothetical protein PRIPAC_94754 [Pristionchus pacificus]|uniref:Uncharacterized protein n=1 Tax=Pristionchus pacificus TaxID=54126 RepID=A0A2A6BAB8_PRIPA|nr:hypothetical protein PRIPAC_94754 [Pristionchus pacificus]|eukprot:PDM62807.1 hypothetical protein PRIPAC_50022 [Pristionchus pacificus]
MTQFVDFKTRGDNILDLVLCNTNIVRNVTPSLPFADHTSISFSLGVPSPPLGDFVPSRLYHLADWESISSLISSHDWTLALSSLDTEHASIYFTNFCNFLLETFVPKSSRSPFSHYPKHLRILYGKSQRASSLASNSMQAASLAKRFERARRVHSERVESRVIDSKNPKAFYSLCKTRLSSSKSAPPGIIDLNGSLLLTNKDKALAFSKYFAFVSTLPMHAPLRPSVPSPTIPLFDLPSISPAQILAGIASLAPKCNFSPDCLPNIFYAKCKFSIVSPLLIIFNKSLHSKSIPSLWKQAIMKPIPKTSSNAISTFRPISLTCSVTKIFQKILISEITSYLERHNFFDFNQAGFRVNRSTCTQLWNLPLNETKCTVVHYGNLSPRAQYLINGTPLSVSPSIKDLGVLMQSSLKFNDHISRIVSKARAKVNLIFKCFFSGLYSRAFSTFVRPLLEYGSVVWSPHTVTLANHIEGVQRNFSKRLFIRCRIPYSLYPDRIAQLSLPTLEHRRLISDILFLHKSIHGFYSYDRTNLFKLSPLARSLRRSHSLRIVLPYSLPKSHSNFVTRAIDRWNVLSAEFVHSSPSNFRSHILSLPSISFILSCGSNTNLLLPRRPTPPNRIVNMTTDLHPKPNEDQRKSNLLHTLACFVKDSCINKTEGTDREKKLEQYDPNINENNKLNNETCDTVHEKKWLVMLKITCESENLNNEYGMKLIQKDILFECTDGIKPDKKLKIHLMHCSITIQDDIKNFRGMFGDRVYQKLKPTLSYSTQEGDKNVTYRAVGEAFWETLSTKVACDPILLRSKNTSSEDYLRYEIDTTLPVITCSPPQNLQIIYREEMRSADDMFCDKSDKHFKYHAKGNLNATIFPKEIEEIDVYCAEKYNQSINCIEDGYELNVLVNLTCNPSNGLYESGQDHVELNGNVFCLTKTGDRIGAATVLLLGLWMLTYGAKRSVATTTLLLLLVCNPAAAVRQPPPNHNPNLQPHAQQTHASAAKIEPDTRSTAPHISAGTAPWRSGGVASDTALRRFRAALHQARPQVAPLNPIIPPNGNLGLATPANAAPPRLPAIAEGSNEMSTGRPAGGALNQGGIRAAVRVNLFGVAGANAADDFPVIMDDGDLNQTQPWNEGDDQGEIDDDLLDNNQLDNTIDEDQAANAEDKLAEMIRRNEAILREIEEAREAAALARANAEAARLLLQRQQDAAALRTLSVEPTEMGKKTTEGLTTTGLPEDGRQVQLVPKVPKWRVPPGGAAAAGAAAAAVNADGARRPNVNPHLVQPINGGNVNGYCSVPRCFLFPKALCMFHQLFNK